jgi:hypothetical protein
MGHYIVGFISCGAILVFYVAAFHHLARNTSRAVALLLPQTTVKLYVCPRQLLLGSARNLVVYVFIIDIHRYRSWSSYQSPRPGLPLSISEAQSIVLQPKAWLVYIELRSGQLSRLGNTCVMLDELLLICVHILWSHSYLPSPKPYTSTRGPVRSPRTSTPPPPPITGQLV